MKYILNYKKLQKTKNRYKNNTFYLFKELKLKDFVKIC